MEFAFIEEVGYKIYEILANDPDQADWYYNIQEQFDSGPINSDELITTIIEYLNALGDAESKNIVKDVKNIIKEDDNIENLLSIIFCPSTGEEETEADDDNDDHSASLDIESNDDDTEVYNPQSYFDSLIRKTMKTLFLSHDITYILLKKYKWKDDALIKDWFSDQKELLKSLHFEIGKNNVPNVKSPLTIRESGVDECPICLDDSPLLEFYCGHKMCKTCLIAEIKQQIDENKVPACRHTYGDKCCGCEFMLNDMKILLSDDLNLFEKYRKVFLNDEIVNADGVRFCQDQYCNYVITPENQFPCHVGICPQCHSTACLKCHRGAHAPLIDCSKIDDFLIHQAKKMQKLKEGQKAWYKKERKYKEFRFNHPDDVRAVFNNHINNMRNIHKNKSKIEQEKIDKVDETINSILLNIKDLKSKLEKETNDQEAFKIKAEIENLENERIKKNALKKHFEMEKTFNSEDRMNNISILEKEERLFMSAILDVSRYEFYMNEFKEAINAGAIEMISNTKKDDDEFIETISKKCPQCKTPIERTMGCNHMTCPICHYEFCYVCGEAWGGHSDYFVCSLYQMKHSFEDSSFDNYNYPDFDLPPMSAETKVDYIRWNNLYAQHNFHFQKYTNLLKELSSKENQKPAPGKKNLTFSRLCTRNKIASVLLRDTERKLVKKKTLTIMNTLLFAQSVITWGYPALYYKSNERKKALVIEYKLSLLQESLEKFMDLIYSPGDSKTDVFERNLEILNRQIFDILAMAEE